MAVRIEPQSEPIPGYRLLERLGAGGFGEVWRAEAPGGINKAIKIIHGDLRSQDNDLVRYAEQELKSLKRVKQVRHPYLLTLDRYDIVDGRLMIVMELADCNLWDRYRECRAKSLIGIPRDELLLYLAETAEVLDLFNDQFQLQHLDIKPQNLFLLANHVKVADFGQVKDLEGLVGPVTGGITPVYAAPETFDGIITRNCDQYSLACVYQELLTGTRPFDGTSLNQLLTQHVHQAPNLEPSPACDRPALSRALAKKPEDRWPSVTAFVRGLLCGSVSGRVAVPQPRLTPADVEILPLTPIAPRVVQTGDTPIIRVPGDNGGPVFTPAPPELTGPGPLRPALVVGLGQTGLRVLQRLRFDLSERYGHPDGLPIVQGLYVDTDPDDLDLALKPDLANRLAALPGDEVFPARLQRASHYLKPRLSGRSLTEGWFDNQLLYRIPRTLQTMGMRMFGRLAFFDHYRPMMGKIHSSLESMVAADAMTRTEATTGLLRRTNRPVVYVVAGLGGATGGGMFLDMAYAVRNRLKRMGYESPQVIGVLIAPPVEPEESAAAQTLGNTHAALVELNHYSRTGTTYSANHDERFGMIEESEAPFTRCFIIRGATLPKSPPASGSGRPVPVYAQQPASGSRVVTKPSSRVVPATATQRDVPPAVKRASLKPAAEAADLIRHNLFEPLGRSIDAVRANTETKARPETLTAFGMNGYGWPRAEIVAKAAAKAARSVLKRWAAPDPKRTREVIPGLAQTHWKQLGLDQPTVEAHLMRAAEAAAGRTIEKTTAEIVDPLLPRGWLSRLPEPEIVAVSLDKLAKLFGPPGAPSRRPAGTIEKAIAEAGVEIASGGGIDIHACVPGLVDDPDFRVAGAEEMLRQLHATCERLVEKYLHSAGEHERQSKSAFDRVAQYAHFKKGAVKPAAAEFTDALRQYPKAQFLAGLERQLAIVYHSLRKVLAEQLGEVTAARQRINVVGDSTPNVDSVRAPEQPPSDRQLMPEGCKGIADAVDKLHQSIAEADLGEIDRRVQQAIEPKYGTVFQACMNSINGPEDVQKAIFDESRAHLDSRVSAADFATIFSSKFHTPKEAEQAIEDAFHAAEPMWVGAGAWRSGEVTVVACPGGTEGEVLRELSRRAIPVAGLEFADSSDAVTIYREWPGVPISALPHAGAAGITAFQETADLHQCTPHSRVDVEMWTDIDAP